MFRKRTLSFLLGYNIMLPQTKREKIHIFIFISIFYFIFFVWFLTLGNNAILVYILKHTPNLIRPNLVFIICGVFIFIRINRKRSNNLTSNGRASALYRDRGILRVHNIRWLKMPFIVQRDSVKFSVVVPIAQSFPSIY